MIPVKQTSAILYTKHSVGRRFICSTTTGRPPMASVESLSSPRSSIDATAEQSVAKQAWFEITSLQISAKGCIPSLFAVKKLSASRSNTRSAESGLSPPRKYERIFVVCGPRTLGWRVRQWEGKRRVFPTSANRRKLPWDVSDAASSSSTGADFALPSRSPY